MEHDTSASTVHQIFINSSTHTTVVYLDEKTDSFEMAVDPTLFEWIICTCS